MSHEASSDGATSFTLTWPERLSAVAIILLGGALGWGVSIWLPSQPLAALFAVLWGALLSGLVNALMTLRLTRRLTEASEQASAQAARLRRQLAAASTPYRAEPEARHAPLSEPRREQALAPAPELELASAPYFAPAPALEPEPDMFEQLGHDVERAMSALPEVQVTPLIEVHDPEPSQPLHRPRIDPADQTTEEVAHLIKGALPDAEATIEERARPTESLVVDDALLRQMAAAAPQGSAPQGSAPQGSAPHVTAPYDAVEARSPIGGEEHAHATRPVSRDQVIASQPIASAEAEATVQLSRQRDRGALLHATIDPEAHDATTRSLPREPKTERIAALSVEDPMSQQEK